ncbi:MAG TPA: L,D-transpeptidase [Acidimicrobiales bacterium]|nr:L,D-transpeptidase [Acidimicrobiales bacterium]
MQGSTHDGEMHGQDPLLAPTPAPAGRASGRLGRRRGRLVAAAGAGVVVAGVVAAILVSTGGPPGEGGRGYGVTAIPSSPHPAQVQVVSQTPTTGWIATLAAPTHYYIAPGGAVAGTLAATSPFGAPQDLAVIGVPAGGWAQVQLPVRPNGSIGWIPTTGAKLTWTPYSVVVSTEAHTVTVLDGGQVVMTVPAAVGAPASPTPNGHTYLWELIRPDNPAGAYGPYIFGLAEFSDTYARFNGGDAQIGLHGNDDASSIGRPVSHGCIRLDNAMITRLAGLLPLGTPVTVA